MSINIYDKKLKALNSIANQTELLNDDGTDNIKKQMETLATKVTTNTSDISNIKANYVPIKNLNDNAYLSNIAVTTLDNQDSIDGFIHEINAGGWSNDKIGLGTQFAISGTIENVPCIVNGKESTKTVEYNTYFVCVAVDFFKPTNLSSGKKSYTFMPFGSPIGTNIIDNAANISDIHAYSQTFVQQKVMPVYAEHFKSIFGDNLAEFSDLLPIAINKSATSYTYVNGGGRSVENFGDTDDYTSYSLRLPSEPEIFGHYVTSGCYDNSGMESQLPYFANKPITTALTGLGYDTTYGMWLSSYSGMNCYGYYDIDKRKIGARPANVEFGIYPLLTLVQK